MAEARLLAGRTGYDVVVHAERYSARLIPIGVYRPLDKSKLPNWKNLDPWVLETLDSADPGNRYGVPYLWGTTGFTYNVNMIRERMPDAPVDSGDMIFKPEVAKRFADCGITFIDEPTDVIPLAMLYLGHDANSLDPVASRRSREAAEGRAAVHPLFQLGEDADRPAERGSLHRDELVRRLRPGHASGEAGGPAGRISPTRCQKEGALAWFDLWFIPADAPHPDNAHQFLNYLLRPDVIGAISNETRYASAEHAGAALPAAGGPQRPGGVSAGRDPAQAPQGRAARSEDGAPALPSLVAREDGTMNAKPRDGADPGRLEALRRRRRGRSRVARHPERRAVRDPRQFRLRQDHAAAHARGLRAADLRADPDRRRGHDRRCRPTSGP